MMKKKRTNYKGFTLIELLIVIGILAVLAVTVLLALNPASAQRKSRDAQRIKDVGTLQTLIDQFITDNPATALCAGAAGCSSNGGSNQCGAAGWLGVNMCPYTNKLPMDPVNGATRIIVTGAAPNSATTIMRYYVTAGNGRYEVCVFQEDETGRVRVTADGGGGANNASWLEAGNDIVTIGCPAI